VAVSADGRRVAVGYRSGSIQLWDAATLQRVGSVLHHPTDQMYGLAFSPDGRWLAAGALAPRGVAVWEVATGELRLRLDAYGGVG
jgi:WD40 repeat protein